MACGGRGRGPGRETDGRSSFPCRTGSSPRPPRPWERALIRPGTKGRAGAHSHTSCLARRRRTRGAPFPHPCPERDRLGPAPGRGGVRRHVTGAVERSRPVPRRRDLGNEAACQPLPMASRSCARRQGLPREVAPLNATPVGGFPPVDVLIYHPPAAPGCSRWPTGRRRGRRQRTPRSGYRPLRPRKTSRPRPRKRMGCGAGRSLRFSAPGSARGRDRRRRGPGSGCTRRSGPSSASSAPGGKAGGGRGSRGR